ncbi:MAG: hypothetical protein ABSF26_28590 [Thermoguttaceae bacterium]|jgi:putative transposase
MYDYRRMTPSERIAVVQSRRARDFPWHKPPHPNLLPGWYFITAATFEHRMHFQKATELSGLELRLLEAMRQARLFCGGWVVMPNHYHLLVQTPSAATVGKTLGPVHGRSARYANRRDNMPGRQVWYKLADRKIRSESHYWTCLHYIVFNPVKHGHAAEVLGWPWSCAHHIVAELGMEWLADLRRDYPLRDFGKGWDD